ncbi:hypothetical protein Tco_0138765 [Tanacetum coccineum]
MSTTCYVDSETITQANGAQTSRLPVPLPDDLYVAVRQAQLVDTNTESDPEEAPSKVEKFQSVASSNSTTPLSPDHLLTYVSPTPTPTLVSFHHRTACMVVRTQPTLSPGMSACIAEAAALSLSSFRKRYRSSYKTSSLSSLTLPRRKRYRGTSELILDIDNEGDELGEEDTKEDEEDDSLDTDYGRESWGLGNKDHGLGDESQGLEDEGFGLEEEEAAPEGQQQAVLVVETAVSEPLRLGYEALRCSFEVGQSSRFVPEQEGVKRISTFRQPTLVTWVDPEDDRVYTDVPAYALPSALRYKFRSLEREQERIAMTFGALWRPVLALEALAGHVNTRLADTSRDRYDDHRLIHDMLVQQASMQRELHEMRGRVA